MRWKSVLKWGVAIALAVPVVLMGLVAVFVVVLALSGLSERSASSPESPDRNQVCGIHNSLRAVRWRGDVQNDAALPVIREWASTHGVDFDSRAFWNLPNSPQITMRKPPIRIIGSFSPFDGDLRVGPVGINTRELRFDFLWYVDDPDYERLDAMAESLAQAMAGLGTATVTAAPPGTRPRADCRPRRG